MAKSKVKVMTVEDFRSIALSMPEASESAHQGHPDFRVRGKIFATVCFPDESWGMVKLTPEQQHEFLTAEPEVYQPAAGGWGRKGCTNVRLAAANEVTLHNALFAAWRKVAAPQKRAKRA
jgi:hypothetical protein